jgi:acetyl esterase
VSAAPDALILLNPVLDTTTHGYGAKMLGRRAEELSLTQHLARGLPPTLIVHGTRDKIVPFRNAAEFERRAKALGDKCELMVVEGAGHGDFNSPAFDATARPGLYRRVLERADSFLVDNGFEAATAAGIQ